MNSVLGRLRTSVVVACLAMTGPMLAGSAHAQAPNASDDPRAEASERFRRGVKLYKEGDFVAALVEFKRAYELEPNYRVLYNLGQTSRELKDYAAALPAFEQYLEEGGKEVPWGRRKEVEKNVEDLRTKVGTLTITTNVEGAEIQVDDVVVGESPLDEGVLVNVGRRRVSASLSGHAPASKVIEVGGTDEIEVELALADLEKPDAAPPPPPPPPPPPKPAEESSVNVAGFVALGVTGVSAIVSGVLGGMALSAQSDLDAELDKFPGNGQAISDAQSSASTLSTATDVMIGVTAVCGVATVVLFVVDPFGDDTNAEQGDTAIRVQLTGNGAALSGSF